MEYLLKERTVAAGKTVKLQFRLTDPASEQVRTDLDDVRVLYFKSPGTLRTERTARRLEDGIYEAELPIPQAGAYYVYVGSPSLDVGYNDLPFLTLRALKAKAEAKDDSKINAGTN